jgi:peptide chain release factor 2
VTKSGWTSWNDASSSCGSFFDLAHKAARLRELETEQTDAGFWSDPERARGVVKEIKTLKTWLLPAESLGQRLADARGMGELLAAEPDAGLAAELEQEIESVASALESFELKTLLSGPDDLGDAILTIHPGAGGTESQDWALMLSRMYRRWAERRGYQITVLDLIEGDEAGIKSVTLEIKGEYAYGFLKAEKGVHRLVRISPFDSQARRHTSFASVFVYPEIEDDVEVAIEDKDLKIDTFRSGGAGGQNVNKVETAIRITHLPSGIVVQCQNERSQLKNKSGAMKVLRARLYELQQKKKEEEFATFVGEKKEIGFGSQIRSYVFQPYQLVKDHRTNHEIGNISAVMDGGIDPFIEAYLLHSLKQAKH